MPKKQLTLTLRNKSMLLEALQEKYKIIIPYKRATYNNSKNSNIYDCELMQEAVWSIIRYFNLRCNKKDEEYVLDVAVRKRTKEDNDVSKEAI